MSQSDDEYYMKIAHLVATRSHDTKYKVGCIVVKDRRILAEGYSGVPSGMIHKTRDAEGKTLPTVIHAEANAICKLAKHGSSSDGATIYCTLSPCWDCAKLIIQSGIKRLVYAETYDRMNTIEFLIERRINVESIKRSDRILNDKSIFHQC